MERNPQIGKGKAPSKMQQFSGEAGPQFQPPYKKLLSENASLKEQMRAKEQSWDTERRRLLNTLTAARNNQSQNSLKRIQGLEEQLRHQQNETEQVKKHWAAEFERFKESWTTNGAQVAVQERVKAMKDNFDKTLTERNRDWENRFSAREQQFQAHLKTLQEDCERKMSQVILERDNLIPKMISDKQCLDVESVESLARLKQKEEDLEKSRAEWYIKHKALEDLLNSELAEKDKKYGEDLDQSRKLSQMDDQLQLLKQKNADLQDSNNQMSQVIQDKDALIKKVTNEKEALQKKNLEYSAKLKKKEEVLTLQSKPNKALEQKTKSEQPAKEKGYKLADPIIFRKDNLIASLNIKIKALQEENNEILARLDKKEEENLQSRKEWETKLKALEAQLGGEPSTKAVAIQSKPNNKALEQKTKSEQPAKEKGYKLADPIIFQKDQIASLNVKIKALQEESMELLDRLDKKEMGNKQADPITFQKDLIASLNVKIKALQEKNIEIMSKLDKKEEENLQSRKDWETKVKALEVQRGGEPSIKAVAIQSKPKNKALEQKTKSEQPAKEKGYKLTDPIIVQKDNLIASLNVKIKALLEENMELLDRLDKKEEEIQQSKDQLRCEPVEKEPELDQSEKLSQLEQEVKLVTQRNIELQEACDKARKTILTMDALTKKMTDEMAALVVKNVESLAKLQLKQEEIDQSTSKLRALEDQLRCELAAKEEEISVLKQQNTELQEACDKVSKTILTMDALIIKMTDEMAALEVKNVESLAKLQLKEEEIDQSTSKLRALEDQLKRELAAKEEEISVLKQQNTELQEACDKVSKTILTMDALIIKMTDEMAALEVKNVESLAKLQLKEEEIDQSTSKLRALEDQLKRELAAKEESIRGAEDLQTEHRKMEEEISVLKQQNTELQKLAAMTDEEKAKMRKEEEKAKKETEKHLKKEREEEEKREKKEKKEREEREKREMKEREENEKKEKKEMKKRQEKEKKEEKKAKKESEKRLKKERQEAKKREKQEKKERK